MINKKLTPFKWCMLQSFPFIEATFDSINNYALLCKIVEYVNKNTVKTNEIGIKVEELNNWFNSLDVQDEINNKLDEMAENGQLSDIISQFLNTQAVIAFNNISEMKNADNISNGSICRTLGENQYNDGKGYYYKIRNITNNDIIDELNILSINNSETLIAERINNIFYDKSNPIYYGADPSGIIDSSEAIQKCLDANINSNIIFTPGIYLINKSIEISYNNKYGGIDFNNSILINNTENDFCIGIGTKNHIINEPNSTDKTNRLYNIKNLKLMSKSNYAILIDRWFMNSHFDNIDIYCFKNGIQIGKEYENNNGNPPSDVLLENFIITNDNMNDNYIGINIIGTDNKIINGRIYGFKTGINCNKNLIIINNIHFLATNFNNNINEQYVAIYNPDTAFIDNCYCDSYPVFVKYKEGHSQVFVNNLFVYSWTKQIIETRIFDYSECLNVLNVTPVLHINNAKVNVDTYPDNFKFIFTGILGNTNNSDTVKRFISKSTFNNVIFTGTNDLISTKFDISQKVETDFINNYWDYWTQNWLYIGNLIVSSNTYASIKLTDPELGLNIFEIITNGEGNITNINRIFRSKEEQNYSIAVKKIQDKCYKLYVAKDKNYLPTTINTQQVISLISPYVKITPATIESFIYDPITTSDVDIISN